MTGYEYKILEGDSLPSEEISMNLIVKDGNSCRSLTEADTSMSTFAVGDKVPVGEFFWINDVIGFDSDAQHGHGLSDGSVDVGCTVTIRAIRSGHAIVRLNRPEMPYGAEAADGIVFQIPVKQMQGWADKLNRRAQRESERRELAKRYCT